MPDDFTNDPGSERRLAHVEARVDVLVSSMETLRERSHVNANTLTGLVATVAVLTKTLDRLIGIEEKVGEMRGELTGHQDDCTRARREDMTHRDGHESWTGKQFSEITNEFTRIRGRQSINLMAVLFAMLGGMATMAWYIITHIPAVAP